MLMNETTNKTARTTTLFNLLYFSIKYTITKTENSVGKYQR